MPDLARQQVAADADPLVVKVGTRVLTLPDGSLDEQRVAALAKQLAAIGAGKDRRVVLVSSGAVGAGIGRLGLTKRPTDVAGLQAAAAVGQSRLIEAYNQALSLHGRHAAQVLLTADDMHDRRRYLNVRNTLRALFEFGAIPIVNENDTVRTEELARTLCDNDHLAAMVANLLHAPLLVILTDVEGLYDGDPAADGSAVVGMVDEIGRDTFSMVSSGKQGAGPSLSTGGMSSKLRAAQIATTAGGSVILASGRRENVLADILAGEPIGTLLPGHGGLMSAKKRWIGWAADPRGKLTLDEGAVRAIVTQGRSLLSIGVVSVEGDFDKGDAVSLCTPTGDEVARGLTNYSADDLRQIAGQPTEMIVGILGRKPYTEAVHRDSLTLLG